MENSKNIKCWNCSKEIPLNTKQCNFCGKYFDETNHKTITKKSIISSSKIWLNKYSIKKENIDFHEQDPVNLPENSKPIIKENNFFDFSFNFFKPSNSKTESPDFGVGCGCLLIIILVIIGLSLSSSFGGAIIGIPLILAGISVLFSFNIFPKMISNLCPYCNNLVKTSENKFWPNFIPKTGFNCPSCKNRIVINNKKFYKKK